MKSLFKSEDLRGLTGDTSGVALCNSAMQVNPRVNDGNAFGAFYVFFQMTFIGEDVDKVIIGTRRLFTSDGKETENNRYVIAVVLLEPDVTFTKGENNTWNLNK